MAAELGSWWSKDTVAVVTGANKGIGLDIVRSLALKGITVVLTSRDTGRGQAALDVLTAEGLNSVVYHQLDVSKSESVEELVIWLKHNYGGIDILINNAAVLITKFGYENAKSIFDINYFGTVKVMTGLLPLFRASPAGARIVNLTSRVGLYERLPGESLKNQFRDQDKYTAELANSLATKYLEDVKAGRHIEEGWLPVDRYPMYSEAKMFLNMYSAALAKSLLESQPDSHRIFVVTTCPGSVNTDMMATLIEGGFQGNPDYPNKTAREGADTPVWLALLPKEELIGKSGKLFGERAEYPFGLQVDY